MTGLVAERAPAGEQPPAPGAERPASPPRRPGRAAAAGALVAWAVLVLAARVWGLALIAAGRNILLWSPPLFGDHRAGPPAGLVLAGGAALVLVAVLPPIAARLVWTPALVLTTAAAAVWSVALAAVDGADGFTRGLEWGREWAPHVAAAADDPVTFVRTYVTSLPGYSVQVRGHPPGFVLVGAGLAAMGRATQEAVAVVVIAAGLTIVPAVALTVRRLAGEDKARRLLPFLALTPLAPWLVTTPDTLTAAVTSWSVYLVAVAVTATGGRSRAAAVGAGALAAAAVVLSYGMVLMVFVAAPVARVTSRPRPLVPAAVVAAGLVLSLALLGFWWPAGLLATRHEYDTLGLDRPYGFFFVSNLAAWALALGPATAAGLARRLDRRLWALAGGGVAAALAANLSGLSEGEVERIWLPFSVWVLTATAALGAGRRAPRPWLVAQVGSTLVLTALIRTYW